MNIVRWLEADLGGGLSQQFKQQVTGFLAIRRSTLHQAPGGLCGVLVVANERENVAEQSAVRQSRVPLAPRLRKPARTGMARNRRSEEAVTAQKH